MATSSFDTKVVINTPEAIKNLKRAWRKRKKKCKPYTLKDAKIDLEVMQDLADRMRIN